MSKDQSSSALMRTPRMSRFLGFLLVGISLFQLFVFISVLSRFIVDPSFWKPNVIFISFGPLAFALSTGYLASINLRGVSQMSKTGFALAWTGMCWGLISLTQRIYPWNIGLALGWFLVGVLLYVRHSEPVNSSDAMVPRDAARRYLSRHLWPFYLATVLIYAFVPIVLPVSERTSAQLAGSSGTIRITLWILGLLSVSIFYLWRTFWKRKERKTAKTTTPYLPPVFPFVIAEYVAVNGFLLGFLLNYYSDQYALTIISALFFYHTSSPSHSYIALHK